MICRQSRGKQQHSVSLIIGGAALIAALTAGAGVATANNAVFTQPTYSSPIAMSRDGRLVWVVNPGDDSVSVIRTDNNTVLRKIKVGDEPQSVALDPNNTLRLRRQRRRQQRDGDPDPQRPASASFRPRVEKTTHDRRRAVEHRHLARRPARLRRQQRPGHDHGHRRADPHDHRQRRPAQQPLQRPRPRTATSSRAAWR